jgi:hypothetical protein
VDNWLNCVQCVVGFSVPGQLPFTFDILVPASVKVCERDGDGSCGQTQGSLRFRIRRRVISERYMAREPHKNNFLSRANLFVDLTCYF